ncbi:MAG TPA: SusC/RagA family TonB-linked outer membrane protein [Paludibacter sp.]
MQNLVTVKGHIRDAATKTPLLGAKVQSKDKKFSAITDEDGAFTVKIPNFVNILYISAPDYSLIEYPVQGKSEIEVLLIKEGAEKTLHSALTPDAQMQAFAGSDVRVITHSATPAMGGSMFIRGYNSLNITAQPLIVLDGVVFDNQYDRNSIHQGFVLNALSNLSMDDVDNIQIIKNGTALYGSKGGNGVIVINTKRGKDPVTQITFSSMMGLNERPGTTPLMNAGQFRVYVSDMLKNRYSNPAQLSSLPFLNDNPQFYDYARYHNDNKWSDDVYQNGLTQSYNFNVNGGDNVALYNLSVGYAKANSTVKVNDFTRFNARFNSDINLTYRFKFSFDLSYAQTDRQMRDDGFSQSPSDVITSPTVLAMIKSPILIPYEQTRDGAVTSDLSDADFLGIANPISIIQKGVGASSQNYLNLSVRPTYQFTPSLKLCGVVNVSLNTLFEKYFRPDAGVADILIPGAGLLYSRNFVKGQNSKQISASTNLYLSWDKKYDLHTLDINGGVRYYNDWYMAEYGSGHNTPTDLNPNLSKGLLYRMGHGSDDKWTSISWYATANYSFLDKYFLNAVITADASSRFGKDADMLKFAGVKWGVYPSIDAAWLISSENFMKAVSFINLLKLRIGYGVTGNDNIPIGITQTTFSPIQYINEYTGKVISNIGNTTLKPEMVEKSNIGIDFNVLNNRLSISADVYHHVTSNLLTAKPLNFVSGMDFYWTNDGKLQNNGIEVSANAVLLTTKTLRWDFGVSIAHYKNKILQMPNGDDINNIYGAEIRTSVGQSAGLFYGYKTLGVFSTTDDALAANLKIADATGLKYNSFKAGDIHFADLKKDGIIDENDKTIIGDPNPDFTGSFNTRFSYKRISLDALFTYSYGNDVYNYVRSQLESGRNLYNQSVALQNRWVNEGQVTSIPQSSYGDPMGNSRFSDRWIEDGSYLRFKSLTLSYDVAIKSTAISGLTIWGSVNNLFTFTKYLGVDPEFSISNSVTYQGIDAGLLPQGRSCFVGLKLNL